MHVLILQPDALLLQPVLHLRIIVIFRKKMYAHPIARPLGHESLGHSLHSLLIALAIAQKYDVPKTRHAQAGTYIVQQPLEGVLGHADGAGIFHMSTRRIDVALRHKGHNGGHESVTQPPGNSLHRGAEDIIVLAGSQVGTVLLDAAGGHKDRRLAAAHGVAHLYPSHLFEKYCVESGAGPKGIQGEMG